MNRDKAIEMIEMVMRINSELKEADQRIRGARTKKRNSPTNTALNNIGNNIDWCRTMCQHLAAEIVHNTD